LSLAAVSAVVAVCNGQTLAIPLDAVVESVRFEQSQIARTAAHESVSHAGRALPFAPLSRALGVAVSGSPRAWSCLIVRSESGTVAVGVDRLLGVRLLVLRSLPEAARATPLVSGATLDALGNPELVLDAEGLVLAVQRLSGTQPHASRASAPILIIDDSLTTRMLEQSILESAGYEVELATSGEEGLAKARLREYALFLVDVEMPGIDGFTFVDRARNDPELSEVPAVLVSSRCAPEDFARGKSAGARGYIVKDRFDQRELLSLIQELVGV
jgi:two-component system chemotaxis sensor kinase CheA